MSRPDASPRVVLVDGNALLYRAHYAFISKPLTNSRGFETSGVFGFVRMLFDIKDKYQPEYIAVAWDKAKKNFRHQLFPDYKGTNNTLGADAQGVMVKAAFDTSLEVAYEKHIVGNPRISSVPIEFYKVEWLDFSWNEIKAVSKRFKALYIDPSRIHPTSGKNQYIAGILNTALEGDELRNLILNYRENLQAFNASEEVRAVNANLGKSCKTSPDVW